MKTQFTTQKNKVSRSLLIKALMLFVCLVAMTGVSSPKAFGQDIRVRFFVMSSCSEGDAQLRPAAGVSVQISNAYVTTDATGYGSIYVRPGLYDIRASQPGASFAFVDRRAENARFRPDARGFVTIALRNAEETLDVRMLTCSGNSQNSAGVVIAPGVGGVTISPGPGGITVSAGGVGVGVSQGRRARLTNINNNVEVQTGSGYWVRPSEGMELSPGDRVRTGVMSSVYINFWEGHSGQLKERSQLQIKSNGAWIDYGEIRVVTGQPRSTPSDFELSTPACTINVRGTIFTANYEEPQQSSLVWVEEGTILLTPSNRSLQTVTVYGGQEVRVTRSYISPAATRSVGVIVAPAIIVGPSMTGLWVTSSGDTVQFTQDGNRVTGNYHGGLGNGVLVGATDSSGVFRGTLTLGQGMNATTGSVLLSPTPDGRLEGTLSSSVYNGPVVLTRSGSRLRE